MTALRKYLIGVGLPFLMFGCSEDSKPDDYAQEVCDCMKSHFISISTSGSELSEDNMPPCFEDTMHSLKAEIKDMDADKRASFIREFLHAALDTECAIMALTFLPVEALLDDFLPNK